MTNPQTARIAEKLDLPHMGRFTRGSRWRFTKNVAVDEHGGYAKAGTEFVVAGGNFYTMGGVINVSEGIYTYATATSLKKAPAGVSGSILHARIYRFVERVDPGPNPIMYCVAKNEGRMGYFSGSKDDLSEFFGCSRFYEREIDAIKVYMALSNMAKHRRFSLRGLQLIRYNAATDKQEDQAVMTAGVEAALKFINHEMVPGKDNERQAVKDIMALAGCLDVYVGVVDYPKQPLIGTVNFGLGGLQPPIGGPRGVVRDLYHRNKFKAVNFYTDRYILLGDSIEDAMHAKMVIPYPMTLHEF